MLVDPQSITISGSAVSFPRTGVSNTQSDYKSADGNVELRVVQTKSSSQVRTAVSLKRNKVAADPISGLNSRKSAVWSIACVAPLDGITVAELQADLLGLMSAMSASSGAMIAKVLGGEK